MGESNENTFIGHLVELRTRLLWSGATTLFFFAFLASPIPNFGGWCSARDNAQFCPSLASELYRWLAAPLIAALPDGRMLSTGVIAPFWIPIKLALFASFVLALPVILHHLWRFVAPGLYQREQKIVMPLVVSSVLLFLLGMLFAYFLVFKVVFSFVAAVAPDAVLWAPDIEQYLGFMMTVFFAFGVAFETPVAVWLLVRSGATDVESLRRARPFVIVGAFAAGAIVTPPDILSQFLLAIPCWLLFEVGLFFAPKTTTAEKTEKEKRRAKKRPNEARRDDGGESEVKPGGSGWI